MFRPAICEADPFPNEPEPPARPLDTLGLATDPAVVAVLLQSLSSAFVAVCLCDDDDRIRYINASFRERFVPTLTGDLVDFVDAIVDAIRVGRGVRLTSMPLDEFAHRIKARRRSQQARFAFSVDFADGSWWWVNDHKLANGWMLVVASEISSIKDEEARLRQAHAAALKAAQTDFLTGLSNRRHGFEQAEATILEARENNLPLTIAILDVDHFKQINDAHGHDAGDKILVHLAGVLARRIGPQDRVSRIGGEEFLVVMPSTTARRAALRLDRVLRRIPALDIGSAAAPIGFTVSAGLASARHLESFAEMLHRADVALYGAKAKGRHRIEIGEA